MYYQRMKHLLSFTLIVCVFYVTTRCCKCSLASTNVTECCFSTAVKIGAIIDFNSTVGESVLKALQIAIQDVNTDNNVLPRRKLVLETFDSGNNPIQATASAMELVNKEVVAVVGPQRSSHAQFLSHMGRWTQIPFVSFGATDPNLSEMQYPYFIRVAPSDKMQMEAVAAFVANYGWKEVVAFHLDDDYGTNGASCLSDSLQIRGSKLVYKVPLSISTDRSVVEQVLGQIVNMQTRIIVLHTTRDLGLLILQEAFNMKMMEYGYVWIVTDLIATTLSSSQLDHKTAQITQGVIGVQRYIPNSPELRCFIASWNEKFPDQMLGSDPSYVDAYALYSYDTVWAVSYAISSYLSDGGNFTFHKPPKLPFISGGGSELTKMKIFQGGDMMKNKILATDFIGISGLVKFDQTGDLVGAAFEYTNMVGRSPHVVGYWWPNNSVVSLIPPANNVLVNITDVPEGDGFLSHGGTRANATQMAIIWPGGRTDKPRGWALPKDGAPLKIGVPRKAGYTELVSVSKGADNRTVITGFCINVFEAALNYLPYDVPHDYHLLGDGMTTPQYDDLIVKLSNQEYDAVVGDVAILADRLRMVDFTQPYIESGLVVLVPVKDKRKVNPWAFLRPFTTILWITVLLSFMFTGMVIWILEHNVNDEFRGPPRAQFITVLTFIFSTLFFTHREDTRSFLGRIVLLVWLFVILIINSSYTANLTSILTVEQLTPTIQDLESLIQSNLPIGYQTGSFVRNFLISLNVNPTRLKDLESREMYQTALELGPSKGGVAAIVDELPYVQLLQVANCNKYIISGQEFTKSGWGFAFPRGSEITADVSQAILQMSQSGELERIKEFWFKNLDCQDQNATTQSDQLDIDSFWGLFLISAIASVVCVAIHLFIMLRNYRRQRRSQGSDGFPSPHFLDHFRQFVTFLEQKRLATHSNGSSSRDKPCPYCGSFISHASSSLNANPLPITHTQYD